MEPLFVYPDGEIYEAPPSWKSDDYVVISDSSTIADIEATGVSDDIYRTLAGDL